MKRELALTGLALLVSVLLSSPTFADPARPTAKAAPAPAPVEAPLAVNAVTPVEELSLDDAILLAATPEERAAVLRRCAGPPPRIAVAASVDARTSEPAVIAQ